MPDRRRQGWIGDGDGAGSDACLHCFEWCGIILVDQMAAVVRGWRRRITIGTQSKKLKQIGLVMFDGYARRLRKFPIDCQSAC